MEISTAIKETLAKKKTSIRVRLGINEICCVEEPKFTKQCSAYFEKNFKKLAEDEPLSLPWKIPEDCMEIEGIMARWCNETNELSSLKGLVLHKFSLTRCLELYGIKEDTICRYLCIRKFSKAPICVTYNPRQEAILLIRKAESDDLATDMALCRNDLKMFILLFNDELNGSGVKLIPLVVSDGKPKVDCDECLNHVLSESKFKSFASLWKKKYFQTKTEGKFKKDFSNYFLAKATSLMAATHIYYDCIPKFTSRTCEEMNNLAVLLTREQLEIFYSQDKHMIVKGGFGCGKTIVAAAILQKISENLGEHEKLFFICYDSRSALINYMIKDKQVSEVCYDSRSALKNYMIKYEQGREVAKVVKFHNKEGLPLSQIIKDILEIEKYPEKVNFIVDEYDGEDLDESEANALNNMLSNTDSLKDAFLMLIAQPIEKERTLNNIQRNGNMFHLLKTMKTHELTLVMRNSTEIHELVRATKTMLSEEKTVYFHEDDSKADQEEKASQIITSGNSAKEIQEVSESPHNEVTSRKKDRQDYLEETPKLGIDEAQAITGSFAEIVSGGSKTVTKFTYAPADETGHNINSKRPALFELEERTGFQKVLSLITIFERLDIRNKRHVLLHFDTVNDEIPSKLQFIFEHHFDIHEKVTNNYQEFASLQKSILVCSYRTFRGLEHQKVTVYIDRDIYFLQHYLVESLSRCTSKLTVVVLQNSATLTKVTDEWKKKQLVNQWETICNKDTQKKNFVFKKQDDKVINGTFKFEYYGKLEEEFNALPTSKDESKMKSFAKNLLEEKG